jgi:multicomponent K+:H+ antiporter subunit E
VKALRSVLPAPRLSLALFVAWPMLNESLSAGHLLLAAVLALAVPHLTERLRPEAPHVGRWRSVVGLVGTVLVDIVKSNITVARLILGPQTRIQPRFIWVPLRLRDPHALVALAGIVTMTPGTLSADFSDDRRHLLIHALDVDDDAAQQAIISDIRTRYEAPLMRIFEAREATP